MNLPSRHTAAYDYTNHAAEFVQLERQYFHSSAVLETIRKEAGGKGVGLELCREIAAPSTLLKVPQHFRLPTEGSPTERWEALEQVVQSNPKIEGWIFRSSGLEEDWADPRCGVDQSIKFRCYEWYMLKRFFEERFATGQPFILQEHIPGIGHVVDIAYSAIFDRPVLHLASGGYYPTEGFPHLSSATNDLEAQHALFDLESGKQLLPRESIAGYRLRIVDAFREIANHTPRFGHQFEVISGPWVDRYPTIALVQVRPSPQPVRCPAEFSAPRAEPMLRLAPAASIGTASGIVTLAKDRVDTFHHEPTALAKECEDAFWTGINKGTDAVHKQLAGQILLWQEPKYYLFDRLKLMLGAAYLGAVAQLTEGPCFKNSNHDGFQPFDGYQRDSYDAVVRDCLFIGLSTEEYKALLTGQNLGRELTLFCDGFSTAVF